ncbi:hypothetical protein EVAR_94702_1 [Eumeta japonica]|uniref:Uncharacterized protein n=1 Tax=Eumeta variegata TaxID=151549 RepID=A0A4C1UX08_EUMVA|nr:hypothetical protein EVAR_94702_1 [Eumeta japonica]
MFNVFNALSADAGAGDVDVSDCRPTASKRSIHDVLFRNTLAIENFPGAKSPLEEAVPSCDWRVGGESNSRCVCFSPQVAVNTPTDIFSIKIIK